MRISRIGVYGLFDRFDHELEFRRDEPVTIMIGPNGFGKTMMLRIIDALFNSPLESLENLPFRRLEVSFDDSSTLCVERKPDKRSAEKSGDKSALQVEYAKLGYTVGRFHSRDMRYGKAALHTDMAIRENSAQYDAEPGWLAALKRSVPVRFIDSERPYCSSSNDWMELAFTENEAGHCSSKLSERADALVKIVNSRFLYKNICVGAKGLALKDDNGAKLGFDMLSSGERRQLRLLYELMFNTPENSLVMIDNPETSLHVYWQDGVLGDLYKIARMSKLEFLLATHSPSIIGDGWDLVVELKGPDDK